MPAAPFTSSPGQWVGAGFLPAGTGVWRGEETDPHPLADCTLQPIGIGGLQ